MSEELSALDAEAIALFHAGTSQRAEWWQFTDLQKNHWRAVALKARSIHNANHPKRRAVDVEAAARTLQANTHDSLSNSGEWGDMTWQEREPWRDRALMVIKAGLEA